jgi:predicted metal-dependent peptidase
MTGKEKLDWMLRFLIVRWRFIHRILGMMTKFPSKNVHGTIGVGVSNGSFQLGYDEGFIAGLKDAGLTFVLYHEILHLVLHHCTHRRFPRTSSLRTKDGQEVDLGNIATDLAVNELIPIENGSCEPPLNPDGTLMGQFVSEYVKRPEFKDMKSKQTAEYYYDFILKHVKVVKVGGKGDLPNDGKTLDDHEGWSEDEIADVRVKAEVDAIQKQALWGDVPADTRELILAAQVRRYNWRSMVKQFFGAMATPGHEATRRRPNRRLGYLLPGSKRVRVDKHLVAIDTSGSISPELLTQFLGVVNGMLDYLDIDLMQFDCATTEEPKPFGQHRKQFEFKGRGGTSFQPVMDAVAKGRYRSVSILTDGQAEAPSKPNAQVLWVMPSDCTPPVDWGRVVTIEKYV